MQAALSQMEFLPPTFLSFLGSETQRPTFSRGSAKNIEFVSGRVTLERRRRLSPDARFAWTRLRSPPSNFVVDILSVARA